MAIFVFGGARACFNIVWLGRLTICANSSEVIGENRSGQFESAYSSIVLVHMIVTV